MKTSDWLSLLAVVISFYAIYLGKLSEHKAKKIENAQKIGQLQLSLMNALLKFKTQIIKRQNELFCTAPESEKAATLKRIIKKTSALIENIDQQIKKLFIAEVVDEVELEKAVSIAKMLERNADHIDSW